MLLQAIADYAIREQTAALKPEVVHHAKRAVIDWYANLLPGSRVPPATLLELALAEELDHGRARLGSGRSALLRAAALINGAASHAVEFDDIWRDAVYHPGAPVIAAALATAQTQGLSGERFLRGVIVGYEVSTRIGDAVMPSHYKFWHTTGTVGCFGAAAATATLLGCDRRQFMNALGTVGTFAAGLQQAFRSEAMSKPMHAAHAAESGVLAALAAAKGVTGVHDILEGEVGFGAAMSVKPDWSRATADLGTDYRITRITFKNHGCCGHNFPSIDAVQVLKEKHRIDYRNVRRIRIATYQGGLDVVANYEPEGDYQAKFSLPYVVAHALVYGPVRLDAYGPEKLGNPAIRDLMKKTELAADPELSQAFPRQRAAKVEIELADGRRFSHFQETRKGDPEMPLTDEELNGKFIELSAPVVGESAAQALLERLWQTERLANVDFETPTRQPARAAG